MTITLNSLIIILLSMSYLIKKNWSLDENKKTDLIVGSNQKPKKISLKICRPKNTKS